MRAIVDTNIFISALINRDGLPARIVRAWLKGKFILVCHEFALAEVRDVSRRPEVRPLLHPPTVGRLVNEIANLAEMPAKLPAVQRSPDPRDDFLLALCEAGRADWLVTGDKADLLSLGKHRNTGIVTAAEFSEALGLNG